MKWVKVEDEINDDSEIWKPETIGEYKVGKYLNKEENVGLESNSTLYFFKNEKEKWKVWGSKLLNSLMDKVDLGKEVKIIYQGKRKSQNGAYYKIFEIYTAEEDDDENGGENSPSSSNQERQSDEEAVNDIMREDEMIARGWLNKVTNDMIGEQKTVDERTLKAEIYNLSQIPAKDGELGVLDMDIAAKVFKLIDKRG